MKKIIFIFVCIFSCMLVHAENVVQIKPVTTKAGIESASPSTKLSLMMANDKPFKAISFDIYLPEGMKLYSSRMYGYGPRIPYVFDEWAGTKMYNMTIAVLDQGNGRYSVNVYPNPGVPKDTFIDGEGSIVDFYYTTSDDMVPGKYPIIIDGLVMGENGDNGIEFNEKVVSFVTIEGESGANSLLDLQDYIVPSFVEEALPTSNVIKNGVCENLVITDKVPFYNSKEFVAKKASYTREATGYNWGTICLPFELKSTSDLSLQALQSISGNTMEFSEVPSTLPYAPYAYCTPEPTALNISVENVTVPEYVDGTYGLAPIVMKSVMKEPVTLENGSNAYYIANDQFWTPTVNPVNVAPMRAYYDIEGAGVKCFGIEGVSTAINGTEAGAAIEGVYNANGAAQNGMKKGVNLVKYSDGTTQKIIIK